MKTNIPDYLRIYKPLSITAGSKVFQSGDSCEQFLFLLDGSIRVDLVSISGKQIMLYRFGSGQTCILTTACLLSGEAYSAEATVEQDSHVIVLTLTQFQNLLDESSAFRQLIFASFAQRLASMMAKIEEISFQSLERRLAIAILGLAGNQNKLSITHEQLALLSGSAREVVSRKLGQWEDLGWLVRGRGIIEVIQESEIRRLTTRSD